jgi:hypothetical protein
VIEPIEHEEEYGDHELPHRKMIKDLTAMVGDPQLGEDLNSGRMEADFVAPLLAGMLEQATTGVFLPVVGGTSTGFDPTERPLVSTITLLDGSKIKITMECEDA